MTFEELLEKMTPEMYQSVKQAVELSKWPDGTRLTQVQKEQCMQAMILYENKNLEPTQRTGHMSGEALCSSKQERVKDISDEPLKWH